MVEGENTIDGEVRSIFEKHTIPEAGDSELTMFDTEAIIEELELLIAQEANKAVEAKNNAYWERNQLVAALTKLYPAWLGYHDGKDWEDNWRTIIYIELPTGQVSWHIHDNDKQYFNHLDPGLTEWDGHTTKEKYQRLAQLTSENKE